MTLGTVTKAIALVACGALGTALADDEKVPLHSLPAAVKVAIKARFPGAELKKAAKENEDALEVSLTYKGDKYDVVVDHKGEIEEIERLIFVDALPHAVHKAIKARFPHAKIKEAEEVTDEDGEVSYEVTLARQGKEALEVSLTPKGKIKKDADDEEDEDEDERHEAKGDHHEKGEHHEAKADEDEDKNERHEHGEHHEARGEHREKGERHEAKADKDEDERHEHGEHREARGEHREKGDHGDKKKDKDEDHDDE